MENFEETEKRIISAMNQIANIIKSNEMDAVCVLYKKFDSLIATPAIIAGDPINIIPAMVKIMQNSPQVRNMILTACDCYRVQKGENTTTMNMPEYLKECIENLIKGL